MPSSVVSVMMYDPATQFLQVEFRATGETYQYSKVPLDEWNLFLHAPSKGMYLNREFKEKNFSFEHFACGLLRACRMAVCAGPIHGRT